MRGDAFRRSVAEFTGAFALTFIGVGSIVITGGQNIVAIALAHGLVIAVWVSAFGHISGGHFNPAVTFGFLITGKMSPRLAIAYWISQLAGGFFGALLISGLLPNQFTDPVKLGVPALGGGIGAGAGLAIEAILTFFLVWIIFATAADPRGSFTSVAGLAIGLTITLDVLMGGPFTGAAMNPSRAFGPQLVGNHWSDAWVWYIGPLIGGGLAALVYDLLYLTPVPRPVPPGPPETELEEPRPGDAAL
ncbi:MAG TPA: aquaporin [Gaiellaceae bacterium]|nr:aquaporin [Gaiellaceae bacterium]